MGIILYGIPFSTCTLRVLAVLSEKEVTDYTVVPIDMFKGEHKGPEHLARQPFGQVPALEDGDISMFESRAIARYIDNKYPDQGPSLFGKTLAEKAKIDTWVEAEHANYHAEISVIVKERVFIPKFRNGTTNEALAVEHEEKLAKILDVYEKVLSKQKYLAGNEFTMADLTHLPYAYYLTVVGKKPDLFVSRPNVNAWWERISSRPAWQKVLPKL